jgi:hypothetical protein
LTVTDATHDLPPLLTGTPRPAEFMPTPTWELRDPTLVTKSFEF